MYLRNVTLIVLIAFISSFGVLNGEEIQKEGAEPGVWTMDFEAAKKLAKEKKLPILLNFTGSDWCGLV